MEHAVQSFRLKMLPKTAKVVLSIFICLLGFGYAVSLGHLMFSYQDVDGKPGVTPEDVKIALYGAREKTKLESKISAGGSMETYIKDSPKDQAAVLAWIKGGADEAGYKAQIKPILEERCIKCHKPDGAAKFRDLTSFAGVAEVAKSDTGESVPAWARVAHIHLMSLSITFVVLGLIFSFTAFPDKVKIPLVCAPFIALFGDFGVRGLVRYYDGLVYIVMAAGAVMALATVLLCVGIFWELWLSRPDGEAPEIAGAVPTPA
jgi:hypothetical protein